MRPVILKKSPIDCFYMAFFQKNIGNFLDRLAVFCIFSYIHFNRWSRRPFSSKHSARDQIQEAWPTCSWPIIHPEADIGHFECLSQEDQSYILPAHHGFFGADDALQVLSSQENFPAFSAKNADCFDYAEVSRDKDTPEGRLPWVTDQENGGVFGILRDQSDGVCGVLLQKRIRTSWYL
jgi:hypothetical protein